MKKTASRMLMTVAAASMAIVPVAAQAGTRASDRAAVYSTSSSAPGIGRSAKGEAASSGTTIILALAATGLIIWGIVTAASSDDNDQSPGT